MRCRGVRHARPCLAHKLRLCPCKACVEALRLTLQLHTVNVWQPRNTLEKAPALNAHIFKHCNVRFVQDTRSIER